LKVETCTRRKRRDEEEEISQIEKQPFIRCYFLLFVPSLLSFSFSLSLFSFFFLLHVFSHLRPAAATVVAVALCLLKMHASSSFSLSLVVVVALFLFFFLVLWVLKEAAVRVVVLKHTLSFLNYSAFQAFFSSLPRMKIHPPSLPPSLLLQTVHPTPIHSSLPTPLLPSVSFNKADDSSPPALGANAAPCAAHTHSPLPPPLQRDIHYNSPTQEEQQQPQQQQAPRYHTQYEHKQQRRKRRRKGTATPAAAGRCVLDTNM